MVTAVIQTLFVICLLLAALEDGWRLRISNIFPIFLIGLFVVAASAQGFALDWLSHLGAAVIVFAAGLFMFARGLFGGGDVKLWAAMALWFGIDDLALFTLAVVGAGGVLALVLITVRKRLPVPADGQSRAPLLQRRGPIPYGMALCIGGLLMLVRLLPL